METDDKISKEDNKKYDVISIGNALMDILVKINEDKFLTLKIEKGSMNFVSPESVKLVEDVLLGHEMTLEPGGASANTLSCLALLGSKVVFCGTVGKDSHGIIYEKKLMETGVKTNISKKEGSTGKAFTFITPDSQRTFIVSLGVATQTGTKDILEEDIKQSKILYLTVYELLDPELRKTCLNAISIAKSSGTKIALDLAAPNVVKDNLTMLKEIVDEHVDILLANEGEASAFTGKSPEESADEIAELVETAVVKLGKGGSIIIHQGEITKTESFTANAVDTTGAGDMYAAGILYGIANDIPMKKASLLGSFLGAKVVEKIGARLSKDEIKSVSEIFEMIDTKLGIKKETDNKSGKKGKKELPEMKIESLGDKKFHVSSQKDPEKYYLVDLNTNWCDCPSFYYNKQECKHIKAVREYNAGKF